MRRYAASRAWVRPGSRPTAREEFGQTWFVLADPEGQRVLRRPRTAVAGRGKSWAFHRTPADPPAIYSHCVFTVCIVAVMSVSRVLLGVLAEGPAHGYDLKHAHDRRFPGARPLAFGQVYAALAKLDKDGLVEIVETGREAGPERMTYALTAAGREALAAWLGAVEPAGPYAADDLVRKTVTALRLGRDAVGFLAAQRQVHLAAMRDLLDAADVDRRRGRPHRHRPHRRAPRRRPPVAGERRGPGRLRHYRQEGCDA